MLLTQVNSTHSECFLVHDETIGKVVGKIVLNGSCVVCIRDYSRKFGSKFWGTHIGRISLFVCWLDYLHCLLGIEQRDRVITYLCVDRANVDHTLCQIHGLGS